MDNIFLTYEDNIKEEYRRMMAETAEAVSQAFTDDRAYAGPTPQELKEIIHVDDILPEKGEGWEKVLDRLKKQILPNFLRTPSTDYMAHLHSASLIETIASELIISTFNQSMDSWDQAPVATEIEVEVIKKLCSMYGYNAKADGVFTSGGSQSNQTALILARDCFINEKLKYDVKKHGLPADFRKLRMYTSEISHFSMEKSAHIMGMGYESVVKVPVDDRQKMDIKSLQSLIESDIKAGNIPYCVVATIGTTDFGSIDPVKEISGICKKYGMWLHADAAYGSGVILSKKYVERIAGLSECDSITVDFHKMFMMPISCSAVLIKDGKNFDALTIHADYLNREEDEEDGYTNLVDKSLQTTRRFDALKVWVSFQTRGQEGWSDLITKCMDNAAYLYGKLKEDKDYDVVTEPEISSVVFRLSPYFCKRLGLEGGAVSGCKTEKCDNLAETCDDVNKRVRRALIHEKGVVIGQTVCKGSVYLKFTLLNPLLSYDKLDQLLKLIKSLA